VTDDQVQPSQAELERENRTLQKRLRRVEKKMQTLEMLQEQSAQLMRALMADLDAEKAESERLLLNILPGPIAEKLKTEPGVIADSYDSVSVLFSDIVGFTPLSESLTAEEMVEWLNEVYSAFDAMVEAGGAEKIRTIGDGYMVAAGVPDERDDHAAILTRLALKMKDHFEDLPPVHGHKANFRIGINSGPVVGGVIGTHKFQYDIWGDCVNTAARMESHGVPGRIHVSAATHNFIKDDFLCEPRGTIEVKGKGEMHTWFVEREIRESSFENRES
jgi:guanylate cyclase